MSVPLPVPGCSTMLTCFFSASHRAWPGIDGYTRGNGRTSAPSVSVTRGKSFLSRCEERGRRLTCISFCRKTTLTKHARRAHRMSTDNQDSEEDSSESESEESPLTESYGTPQSRWPHPDPSSTRPNELARYPTDSSQSVMHFKAEGMTPFSSQESHSATSRSGMANPFDFNTNRVMHGTENGHVTVTQPLPISQSAVYSSHQQCDAIMSPVASISTPTAHDYGPTPLLHHYQSAGHRLDSSVTPTPQHISTAAQTVQSSPDSLSCGSSQPESANSHELYYAQVQSMPIQHYQLQPTPLNHDPSIQYQHYQSHPSMPVPQQFQTIPQQQGQPQQQSLPPQVWYDTMAYHPPVMISAPEPINQTRLFAPSHGVEDWWIKQEDNGMLLPSARISNL